VVTLEDAARLAMELPGVTEGERHGHRTWLANGKVFAWERPFSKADIKRFGNETPPDGDILALSVEDLSEKEAALEAHPGPLFTISHFDGYAAILVHLRTATVAVLRDAVLDAWLVVAAPDVATGYLAENEGKK
jgi:hypothetical protein